ncbi:hypothetical protein F4556_001367 [Kitasatospora gansuensis]|uniref:Uncharacterized protein n=1 Tax=Kitasatospora gansuensis TaxID=258050 RepID=A0A7W7S999_9ACTN|nr:hypothetical protein [Kitasatospora gansuensis]
MHLHRRTGHLLTRSTSSERRLAHPGFLDSTGLSLDS